MLWPRLARALVAKPLTDPAPPVPEAVVQALAERLDAAAQRRLGRSLAIRQVDAGSCNGCELEINALQNVVYDLERFGLRFVASPRHADVLLVTGPVTRNMAEALARTYAATQSSGPAPSSARRVNPGTAAETAAPAAPAGATSRASCSW